MKQIAVGEFKTHCLSLFEEVRSKKERIIVTKRGLPMAEIIPIKSQKTDAQSRLAGSIIFENDLISPIEENWEAETMPEGQPEENP